MVTVNKNKASAYTVNTSTNLNFNPKTMKNRGTIKPTSGNSSFNIQGLGNVLSGASNVLGNALNMAKVPDTSELQNQILNQNNNIYSGDYNNFDSLNNAISNLNTNQFASGGEVALGIGKGAASGAAAGSAFGPWGIAVGGAVGGLASGIGRLINRSKINDEERRLYLLGQKQNDFAENFVDNSIDNMKQQQYADQFNFHSFGGNLDTQGSSFPLGYTEVNTGGTHEENPYEGIQIGVDNQGVPNLVEEGEVIYNDYVFSNRLTVPKDMRKKYKLGNKDISFADAFKKLSKESSERPNDSISQRGLEDSVNLLMQAQENERFKKLSPQEKAMLAQQQMGLEGGEYSHGGHLGNLFLNGGGEDNRDYGYVEYWPNLGNPNVSSMERLRPMWQMGNASSAPKETVPQYPLTNGTLSVNNTTIPTTRTKRTPKASPIETPTVVTPERITSFDINMLDANGNPLSVTPKLTINDAPLNVDTDKVHKNRNLPKDKKSSKGMFDGAGILRYAPVAGAAIGLMSNLASKPSYETAKLMEGIARRAGDYDHVAFTPIGNYLTYRPFDRQYALNQLNAKTGQTMRALKNSGLGPSVGAHILAADASAGNQTGNLFRQAEEFNRNLEQQVAAFNRGTDQYNSEGLLKADIANQSARAQAQNLEASLMARSIGLRDSDDARRGAAYSANLTNLFNSLGAIGKESVAARMARTTHGYYTAPNGKLYYNGKEVSANGGLLTFKNKRRGK